MILDCSCAENMSQLNCYLCASDEGILLDIFGDAGKAFREYIETCLSVKVKLSDAPSTKLCHKCAYELESCDKFLARYKRFGESLQEGAASKARGQCRLCGETPKKLRLLRVEQGNSRKNLLDKLQHVSLQDRNSLKENVATFSVCLDCRYNLDLLSDLKTIHRESVKKLRNVDENGQKILDFSKIKTSVVKRKTTYIPEPKLTETSSWDSGASSTSISSSNSLTMPLKRRRVRSVKEPERTERTSSASFRKCEECDTQVDSGIDMYRYHRSGQTVCKDCWLTMDPEKVLNAKRKRLGSSYRESGTKLCAVFLKDVLSNPAKYSNAYRVEKDKDGNKTFLITDESSESDEKDRARPKRLRPRVTDSSSPAALETIPETRKASKRPSAKESKTEQQTVKKGRSRGSDESVETSPVPVKTTRARNGLAVEADSTNKTRSRRNSSESTTASTSLAPETDKKNPPTRKTARAAKNAASKKISADEKSFESGSSSNESRAVSEKAKTIQDKKKKTITITKNKNQRASRRARSNSFTGSIIVISDDEQPDGNSSEDSSMPLISRKTKRPSKTSKTLAKNAKSDSELDKPYTCSICQLCCKNTLVGKAHELTHEKQPKVELRRVVVEAAATTPETNAEETPHEPSIAEEDEKDEENEKENSHDDKNGNAASAENPEQPIPANEQKTENENIATPEKSVAEEKPESSPVRDEPEDEMTTNQNLDDQNENKEETNVPLEQETETPEPVDKNESLVQETITERIENDENAANENKENDDSEEKLSKEKVDEASDKVEETSAESKQVEIEPPEVPIPRQPEPEETTDVTSAKETEETTENARTADQAEPMEVTEAEENEKTVEEKTERESCENDAKATENEEKSEQGNELDIPVAAKTASEPEFPEAVEKTPEVLKAVEETGKDEEKENSNGNDEEKEDEEESSTNREQESAEKLTERDDEEQEATKLNGVETEREENPEERLDSSRDEKESDEQVSLVVEDGKENEQPDQQSEKQNNEEKKEEHNEIKGIPEADETSNESSIAGTETPRQVFELASDEVKKRLEHENSDKDDCAAAETLENISIEIQSGNDMPSLELEAASTEKS